MRKHVEAMALGLEEPQVVRNLQRFLTDYQWDEPWMRQQHWQLAAHSLADAQGVWSIDASEFAKQGAHSVGVAPQYCGALGKTAHWSGVCPIARGTGTTGWSLFTITSNVTPASIKAIANAAAQHAKPGRTSPCPEPRQRTLGLG